MEHGQSQEIDLDKTDKLPILEGILFDPDVEDDAVRMEHLPAASLVANVVPGPNFAVAGDFIRPSAIDLPSLADSVRTVEERIARQNADFEVLRRSYERARDAEAAAVARAGALERDLAALRAALDAEQARLRESERGLAEKNAALETTRARLEETARETERQQSDARNLRDSLATRDATIVQVLHSLGERDAQLALVQQEQAKIASTLESRARTGAQVEAELSSAKARGNELARELNNARETAAELSVKLKASESEMGTVRSDLSRTKAQSEAQLEVLRSREWRRGFEHNQFRELDARIGSADEGRNALKAERDKLHSHVANLELKIAAQSAAVQKLESEASAHSAALSGRARELQDVEAARADLAARLFVAEEELTRLRGVLEGRDTELAEARGTMESAARREAESAESAQRSNAQHAAEIAKWTAEADTREEEMSVLMAHLQEARRPIEAVEADVRRLTQDLAAKSAAFDALNEENGKLQAALERARGALEEREFLIRRLERSESNNANVLGRIQTSMERLGSAPMSSSAAALPEWTAELIRIDGDRNISHTLGRRTRIGRSTGCELQIDSSSVSRNHALIVTGPRETVIEDLNSTNGVIVNGRKVSRAFLNDGDIVIVGEIHFRYAAKGPRPPEPSAPLTQE